MSKTYSLSACRLLMGLCCLAVLFAFSTSTYAAAKKQVLVISVTKGFRHSSIPLGEQIVKDLGDKSGLWETDFARDDADVVRKTSPWKLKAYDLVFLNNTTGILPIRDRQAFLDWIKAGGAVAGIHAATDTFHGDMEFINMMGAEFKTHGAQSEDDFLLADPNHPVTKGLPDHWKHLEEVYQFTNYSTDNMHVLIYLDKHPVTFEPGFYPISWVKMYGKGRVFYTAFGHREDLMQGEYFHKHLLQGLRWALGYDKGDASPNPPAQLTKAEAKQGFVPLFNGNDLTGWHNRDEGRTQWTAQDGMVVMGHGGADLITDEKFGDFVIRYEYMCPKGGNSGLYLRGRYEIQVLDDTGKTEPDIHSNGSLYGMITPTKIAQKAPGEWNTVEATLVGNNVTVILNGVKIIDNQPIEGITGGALDDKVNEPGPIMLQGDHGPVAYRCIRIKRF
jgi:type 1 glutamine amidotransferase